MAPCYKKSCINLLLEKTVRQNILNGSTDNGWPGAGFLFEKLVLFVRIIKAYDLPFCIVIIANEIKDQE